MGKKITKSTSSDGNVEISVGEIYESKRYIMEKVAASFSIYGATVWLNTPMETLQAKTPAEAMKEGNLSAVLELIKKL